LVDKISKQLVNEYKAKIRDQKKKLANTEILNLKGLSFLDLSQSIDTLNSHTTSNVESSKKRKINEVSHEIENIINSGDM